MLSFLVSTLLLHGIAGQLLPFRRFVNIRFRRRYLSRLIRWRVLRRMITIGKILNRVLATVQGTLGLTKPWSRNGRDARLMKCFFGRGSRVAFLKSISPCRLPWPRWQAVLGAVPLLALVRSCGPFGINLLLRFRFLIILLTSLLVPTPPPPPPNPSLTPPPYPPIPLLTTLSVEPIMNRLPSFPICSV